jgi:hypothetical protein
MKVIARVVPGSSLGDSIVRLACSLPPPNSLGRSPHYSSVASEGLHERQSGSSSSAERPFRPVPKLLRGIPESSDDGPDSLKTFPKRFGGFPQGFRVVPESFRTFPEVFRESPERFGDVPESLRTSPE